MKKYNIKRLLECDLYSKFIDKYSERSLSEELSKCIWCNEIFPESHLLWDINAEAHCPICARSGISAL